MSAPRIVSALLALLAVSLDARVGFADGGLDGGVFLPGTQPNELTLDLRPPSFCGSCHGGYSERSANDSWNGTMMANAARDPLFHAALTIANQDVPGSGDLCIRCHSPRAWLFGRSSPPLISGFEPEDFEGISCDFCHRLVASPGGATLIGTGQYYVADDYVRRGPIKDPLAPHDWEQSDYFAQSRLCGLCHDVSNPLEGNFAIERTYSEWAASVYPSERTTCQTCHMPAASGKACGAPNMPDRMLHAHELAGGNSWMPRVLAGEYPELGRGEAYERTAKAAEAKLRAAAALTLQVPPLAKPGQQLDFTVRVENRTGHKLPTGYPEGRRCWLEVAVRDAAGKELFRSGAYDSAQATRANDPQLRTYEVRMAANGKEGFHFILQNELLQDNRIPPRGFVSAPDMHPVGRVYPTLPGPDGGPPVLAHWDDAPYSVPLVDEVVGPLSVEATLWYQTTSREYVEALRDENVTDSAGQTLFALWEKYGQAPPVAMAKATQSIGISGNPGPDLPDASSDAPAEPAPPVRAGGGCDCRLSPDLRGIEWDLNASSAWLWGLAVSVGLLRRRRTRR